MQHRLFKLSCKIKSTVSCTLFPPTDHIAQSHAPTLPLFSSLPNTITPRRTPHRSNITNTQPSHIHTPIPSPKKKHQQIHTHLVLLPLPLTPFDLPPHPISHPPSTSLSTSPFIFSAPHNTPSQPISPSLRALKSLFTSSFMMHIFEEGEGRGGGDGIRRGRRRGNEEKKRKEKREGVGGGGRGRGRADAKASKEKKQVKRAETAECVRDLESYVEV